MRRFLFRTLFFFLPLLLLIAAGEAYVRSLPNPAKTKHTYLTAHADEIRTLVLGSSHEFYGVAAEDLGPAAFNAALPSQTLRYDHYILSHYTFRHLQTIIVPISDFTLFEDFESDNGWWNAIRYRLYMDCPYHSRLSRYGFEAAAFPVFMEKLQSLYKKPRVTWNALGQGTNDDFAHREADWQNSELRAAINRSDSTSIVALNEAFLDSIATLACGRYHARLVLLTTPLMADYRARQNPEQMALVRRAVARLQKRWPEVVWLDYSACAAFTLDDFYDADHLTLEASHKLSRLLREDLAL